MKTVYVAMSADRMHPGRLDIIRTAAGPFASIIPTALANNSVMLPPELVG